MMSIAILKFITQILRFVLLPFLLFSCASSSKLQSAYALGNPQNNSVRNSRNQNTIQFDYEKMLLGKWKLITEYAFSTLDDECCDDRTNDDDYLKNKTIEKTRKNVIWTFNSNMSIFIAQNGNITKETYEVHYFNMLTIGSKKYIISLLDETQLLIVSNVAGFQHMAYTFQKIQ
ncbi:MAG: hypothetical protein HRT68_04045 [Flavobacteriaceae bacterium]|nr:hypothetical protein [Flavobacteriaceae bacterium]